MEKEEAAPELAMRTVRQDIKDFIRTRDISPAEFGKRGDFSGCCVWLILAGKTKRPESKTLYGIVKTISGEISAAYPEWKKAIGGALEAERIRQGLDQTDFPVHRNSVRKLEAGEGFTLETLVSVSGRLGLSWQGLTGYKNDHVRAIPVKSSLSPRDAFFQNIEVARLSEGETGVQTAERLGVHRNTLRVIASGEGKVYSGTLHKIFHANGHVREPDCEIWKEAIAKRLKTLRSENGLFQQQVADRGGLSRNSVDNAENKRMFSLKTIASIAEVFGLQAEDILYDRQLPATPEQIDASPEENAPQKGMKKELG